ncbi:MAG: YeeE/YedE family protein [Bacillota bacterium]|nr:YeeE/YedE family protein [Bacillota bacterium]
MNKKKHNQVKFGMLLFSLNIILVGALVFSNNSNVGVLWVLGLCIGFVMQRSRICIASSFRDIFLLKNTAMAQALLVYLIFSTLLFGLVYRISELSNLVVVGKIEPVGLLTVAGAIIFGIGMVIAGGCVAGTVTRMGEGLVMQWISFTGLIIGSILGARHFNWFGDKLYSYPKVYIPEYLGFFNAMLFQILFLGTLFLVMRLYEKNNSVTYQIAATYEAISVRKLYHKIFVEAWPYGMGAVILAVLNALLFLYHKKPLGITSSITHMGAGALDLVGMDFSSWQYFDKEYIFFEYQLVPLVIAMFIGSLLSCLLAGEFRIRPVRKTRFVISALFGGMLMGYGSRLADGCNVGAILSGIPSLSLHGWVFIIGLIPGVLVGIKILTNYLLIFDM